MNTHLHVLEAYTNLYRSLARPLSAVNGSESSLEVFDLYIIDADTGHLVCSSGKTGAAIRSSSSYGHDIEAAWLLQEAATVIGDEHWIERTTNCGPDAGPCRRGRAGRGRRALV